MSDIVKDLEIRLAAATEVRQKIDALNALAWELKSSNLPRAFSLSEEAYTLVIQDKQEEQLYEKGLAESLRNLGYCHIRQEEETKALSPLQQALTIAENIGSKRLQIECHEALASVNKRLGNFEMALSHYEQFHTIKEGLFNEETAHKLKTLEVIHQTETTKKEAEIYQLKSVELEQEIADRKRSEDRATRRASELATLVEIGQDISATLDLPTMLERIASRAKELLQADQIAIYLQQPDRNTFVCLVALGEEAESLKAHVVQPGQGIMGDILQRGVAEIIEHAEHDPRAIIIPGTVTSAAENLLCVPLATEQGVIGLITLWRTGDTEPFTSADLNFLVGLSQQATIAIQNAKLFHEAQQAQEEAEKARQVAEAANKAKSIFLANMSHELRTPLNAILGFSQIMARSQHLIPEHRDNLDLISRSGEHLLTLINQILDLSKIEAGRMTLNEQDFDLYHLLDDIVDMFRLRAEEKHLRLLFDRSPDVPCYVRTDGVKLRQVLINLLNNAIKFTEEGSITLRIANCGLRKGPTPQPSQEGKIGIQNLKFEVEDTGPGIAPDELQSLFDIFVQTRTGQVAQEGTGLGLPISQKFVQLMGGEMTVSSEVGRGSTFSFDIRVSVVEEIETQDTHPTRQIITLESDQPRYRILIVDDKWDNRQFLVKLLKPFGFELQEAEHGQEALEIWKTWKPHLILMDMRMPVMDGYEATKRIRELETRNSMLDTGYSMLDTDNQPLASSPQHPASSIQHPASSHTPIIAITASSFDGERTVGLSAGCDDFLRKPFREGELFDLLHKHLSIRYVYEDVEGPETQEEEPSIQDALDLTALAALPVDLQEELEYAAITTDITMISTLIEQIRSHDTALADALACLADNFEYTEILTCIQEVKKQKKQKTSSQ